ncbi:MAG: FtsX-like permease family protein [Gammaproteobacteria bacterium]|nr:FtsX-like permease family protein [Gammaproteobacteria bacterium]
MKYLPLVWAALWRRKPRTIYTMLSVAVAFLLYALLTAVNQAFNAGIEVSGADRLITTGRYSITQVLPLGYLQQIRNVPGVETVTVSSWFGGVYQEEKNFFPQFPVEPETYLAIYPEILLPPEQKQAFLNTRTGCIVAKSLADRFGWKLGDKIPLQAGIWPLKDGGNTWTLDLVGIFDTADPATRSQFEMLLMRHDFFDEARQFANGYGGWYIAKVKDPAQSAQIAQAIDKLFANSPGETRTDTEKAFNQSFLKQMGDIGLIISSILGAVFFTLLFLTGNTMMQSVRERVPELAVLKTIGFSDNQVLGFVLAESALLCVVAAMVGLAIGSVLLPGIGQKLPGFSGMELTLPAFGMAVLLAFALAVVVGILPGWRAKRLDIVNALSGH